MKNWEISRRRFFKALGGIFLGGVAARSAGLDEVSEAHAALAADPSGKATKKGRKIDIRRYTRALKARAKAYRRARKKRLSKQKSNTDLKNYGASFAYTKVLPKDTVGETETAAFKTFKKELNKGKLASFEDNVITGAKGMKNPIGSHAVDLQGYDATQFTCEAAPSVISDEGAAEMSELYWQALCRDVNFDDYWTDDTVSAAASDLTSNFPGYAGPSSSGTVTPGTIFRSSLPGRLTGPHISQLLFMDVESGRLLQEQKIRTTKSGADWMTREDFYLFRQGGNRDGNDHAFADDRRYIINGRDLAMYVWDDRTYMPYVNAFLILYVLGIKTNAGNPYRFSRASTGFITGEYPHFMTQLAEVSIAALKAAWWQKWNVHLRLRPEEFAGRIHFHKTGKASYPFLPDSLVNAESVERIITYNGAIDTAAYPGNGATYLLPQVYPEGSPNHPAYPSGHATIAGACATLLKAFFDEGEVFENPVIPSSDGSSLESYDGDTLTVGNEINKLASNIAEGRNFAGIHYRSDMEAGLKLGEQVALEMLKQWNLCFTEAFSFRFTKFDGTQALIR